MATALNDDIGVDVELERKYFVDPDRFPDDLTQALRDGTHHPDILRRGRITQLYLPVERDVLRMAVYAIMLAQPHSRLTPAQREYFSDPRNITEVRVLQREQGFIEEPNPAKARARLSEIDDNDKRVAVPDAFQITVKGKERMSGMQRGNIETDIVVNKSLCRDVADLIEHAKERYAWREDEAKVEKMWYDIRVPHPDGNGQYSVVELDIFPDLYYMSVAEIEADDLEEMQRIHEQRPAWLSADVTHFSELKVRNLAGRRDVSTFSKEVRDAMRPLVGSWLDGLYQPTILGESIRVLQEEFRSKSFVVVGSFVKWLPHVRRIVQDLRRQCRSVYPSITTLDIARRQSMEDVPNLVFRIEEELNTPRLIDAESNYVRQIRERDALFVVAPDGRLGESSGREAVEAFFCGKEIYLSAPINRVSKELSGRSGVRFPK